MSGKNSYKYKTGLACMRVQPFHTGHQRLIDKMLSECETCFLAIGSANEEGTERNPISYTNRKRLVENFYVGDWMEGRLFIFPATDINDLPNWSTFVTNMVPFPVDIYYAGTEGDAIAFRDYPPKDYQEIKVEVLERDELPKFVSATEIRNLFNKGNPTWKLFIPTGNVDITERVLNGLHPFPKLEELENEMGGELE